VLYGGYWLKENQEGNPDDFVKCPLWVAQYGLKPGPVSWKKYTLWQYTDGHNSPLPRARVEFYSSRDSVRVIIKHPAGSTRQTKLLGPKTARIEMRIAVADLILVRFRLDRPCGI
jgi:hypothetical protein